MNPPRRSWCARGFSWWLRRNPMYLLSAGCMAVGARLYLVSPSARAGDLGLILLTMGALQLYEWLVLAILVALRRFRRSPEDAPSLMLVVAVFWTGPLAATAEMGARDAHQGLIFSIAVGLFALLELLLTPRALTLRFSAAVRFQALAAVALLVVTPRVLHVYDDSGTNELFLYSVWWCLAALALFAIASLRASARHTDGHVEPLFSLLLVAAVVTHLYGMNYAFLGHARLFYVAPLLIALSAVACEYLGQRGTQPAWRHCVVVLLPVAAIAVSCQHFHADFPVRAIPFWLRDPLSTALIGAALAWWFGAQRLRSITLAHLGSGALVVGLLRATGRLVPQPGSPVVTPLPGLDVRAALALLLGVLTAYLLVTAILRRSRAEALLGLIALQPAIGAHFWGHEHLLLALGLVGSWSILLGQHLQSRRPRAAALLTSIALMLAISWIHDHDETVCWQVRANMAALVMTLFAVGHIWPATRYRSVAGGVVAANGLHATARIIAGGPQPVATLVIVAAFALLLAGAAISWCKRALLALTHAPGTTEPTRPPTADCEP